MAWCLDWGSRFPEHPHAQRKGFHAASPATSSTTTKYLPWVLLAQILSSRWETVKWCEGKKNAQHAHCRQPRPHAGVEVAGEKQAKLPSHPHTLSELFRVPPPPILSQLQWQALGRASDGPWRLGSGIWGTEGSEAIS